MFFRTLFARQRERHINAARPAASAGLPARRIYHDILRARHLVRDRRGIPRERQSGFPKQLAGAFIEGAELAVEVRRSDKHQAAGSYDRAAIVLAAGVL